MSQQKTENVKIELSILIISSTTWMGVGYH